MEYENGVRELGDVQHTKRTPNSNSDFSNASPNAGHRLPIARLEPLLDKIELEAGAFPSVSGECP